MVLVRDGEVNFNIILKCIKHLVIFLNKMFQLAVIVFNDLNISLLIYKPKSSRSDIALKNWEPKVTGGKP